MLKQLITIAILLASVLSLTAQDESEMTTKTLHIAPYQQDCVGVGPQDCLVIRWEDEDELSFFYDSIEGFTFEEGFEYTLLVNITERENVPADASSLQYELVEVLQQYPAHLAGKVWELQSLNGVQIDDPSRYTLLVTDDGASMQADCNRVQANIVLNPFSLETTISTKAMCPEDSLDTEYLEALNAVNLMSIENGELILQSSEGQLRFAPPNIEGQGWTLTRVLGMAMMLELDDSVSYKLHIEDNLADLTIACNTAQGTVEFDGAVIQFTEVMTTLMACEDDPLLGMFPPENAVYYITEAGHLILEDDMSNLYEFVNNATE